jgi:hypothetical protein
MIRVSVHAETHLQYEPQHTTEYLELQYTLKFTNQGHRTRSPECTVQRLYCVHKIHK